MASRQDKDRPAVRRLDKAADGDAAPSRTVAVQTQLRAQILAGEYAPGARLSPRALADRFEVSLSVVREALSRLTEQGLVVAAPQLGFSVVSLDVADLVDLTKVRVLIEGAAFREAVEHADVEYEALVVGAHHRLTRTPFLDDVAAMSVTDEWAAAHATFHDALISASPSPRLRGLAASLRDRAELYRRWSGPLVATEAATRDVACEHRELMDAALSHDADRAEALLAAHINRTTDLLLTYVHRTDKDGGAADEATA
ncbi:GntR family transcriptional regulator [Yinghuangia seranimata]|uniref:GntR family transcriptional regulator n=1 Tax=Yinghuangia seranimata TaxID=408067 RepID=UPI00248BBB4B|nr:GntR family transcriptional regulator [Yinghuangia seranimata]MDI2124750.1 GntR family transcriptional regulator [Yinghuangia seranimata]